MRLKYGEKIIHIRKKGKKFTKGCSNFTLCCLSQFHADQKNYFFISASNFFLHKVINFHLTLLKVKGWKKLCVIYSCLTENLKLNKKISHHLIKVKASRRYKNVCRVFFLFNYNFLSQFLKIHTLTNC